MKRSLLNLFITLCAAGLVHADQTIRALQQTLKDQGLYYGTVTGKKSAETTAAIRRYQIRSGLQVTGEINPETSRSLNSNSTSVVAASRSNSKPAAASVNSVHPDASRSISQTSSPSFHQPERQLQADPPYSATFSQSQPLRLNRQVIAGAQQLLRARGYYRSRIDGKYGPQTAVAVRSFQASTGLPLTGRLDIQTVDTLGLSETSLAYLAPASRQYERWIPVRKFKHGKWKAKWKKHHRPWGRESVDQDQQANRVYGGNSYDQ